MSTLIKTAEDITHMREAGRLAADVLMMIGEHVRAGITTEELDRICHQYIVNDLQAIPAPLNYGGAPGAFLFLNRFAPQSIMSFAMAFRLTKKC